MISIRGTIEGNQAVIDGIAGFAKSAPAAVRRGLVNAGRGVYAEAFVLLSGPGRPTVKKTSRPRGQHSFLGARPGSYPVPIMSGNLRGRLGILEPGQSKKGEAGTFTAADNEVIVYDSAAYAHLIRDGKGSSSKYGPRDFTGDGLKNYDQKVGITTPIEEELQKEIDHL